MSGKRRATDQISKETFHREEESDDEQQRTTTLTASADVIAKRKILRPKSRLTAANNSQLSKPSSGFSFGSSTTVASSGPFNGFSSKPIEASKPFSGLSFPSTDAANVPKPNPFASVTLPSTASTGFGSFNSKTVSNPTSDIEKNSQLKALNDNFVTAITKQQSANPASDLSSFVQKYVEYIEKIKNNNIVEEKATSAFTKPTETSTPSSQNVLSFGKPFGFSTSSAPAVNGTTFTKPAENEDSSSRQTNGSVFGLYSAQPSITKADEDKPKSAASSSSSSSKQATVSIHSDSDESDDEIKVEGPKFVLDKPPTTKRSVFSLGPKPASKANRSDSDSDDDIKIEGPKFSFGHATSKISLGPFKFDSTTKNTFSFGQSENKKDETPTTSDAKDTSTGIKEDSKLLETKKDKPANIFSFTSSVPASDAKDVKPFSFGNAVNSDEASNNSTKSAFSFGVSSQAKESETAQNKSIFSLPKQGELKVASEAPTGFSLLPKTQENNESQKSAFNSKPIESVPASFKAPTFSFSAKPSEEQSEPQSNGTGAFKSQFSFSSNTSETSKPAPVFGQSMSSGKQANNFTWNDKKPISFGTSSNDSSEKPAGLFSSIAPPSVSSGTSAFKFGDTASATSSFGSGKSSFNFSFTPATAKPNDINDDTKDKGEDEKVEEVEVKGDYKITELKNKVEDEKTGEEDEDLRYIKRSKLMLFDSQNKEQPYTTKGLGELKVLKHKSTGKTRLLLRAEGSNRVLLNTLINKDMVYSTIGKGDSIRVPVVNEDKTISTYILRVKTAADGESLLKAIDEGKI